MSIRFDDQVAIVTGAGGGLGKEHALGLARRGAKVVVNDLGGGVDGSGASDAAKAVVDQIISEGGEAIANGASVTDLEAVQAMVQEAKEKWGRIDILVNNAGIHMDNILLRMKSEEWNQVMNVNLNPLNSPYPKVLERQLWSNVGQQFQDQRREQSRR